MQAIVNDGGVEGIRKAVLEIISKLQGSGNSFRIVLSGGSMVSLLDFEEFHSNPSFTYGCWSVFLADERYVPLESEDSTWNSFKEKLSNTPFFKESFFPAPIPSIEVDISLCCKEYSTIVGDLPFDLVLLGLGPDGHTASLFPPFKVADQQEQSIIPVFCSPKPPPTRITMSIDRLKSSLKIVIIALGSSKAEVVEKIIKKGDLEFPPTHLSNGNAVELWLDEDSGRLL